MGNSYGYLFYEALVKKKAFQTEEGFLIPADNRDETFRRILTAYGFNEQETADFIEYWSDYLKGGTDYLMYPMLTDGVNAAMPVSFSVNPDSISVPFNINTRDSFIWLPPFFLLYISLE